MRGLLVGVNAHPRLRFFLIKLKFCIFTLRDRSSGSGKILADRDDDSTAKLKNLNLGLNSGEHCLAAAVLPGALNCGVTKGFIGRDQPLDERFGDLALLRIAWLSESN
jgi:hypothetical protein